MDAIDLQNFESTAKLLRQASVADPAIIDQIVIDSRRIHSPNSLFVALPGARDGHEFVRNAAVNGAKYALVRDDFSMEASSPLVLLRCPSPLKMLQELAAYYRSLLKTTLFVGIAGSYGKTMVKDLLWAILKKTAHTAASPDSFNSQIGVPLSIFTASTKHSIALIEAAVSFPHEMDALEKMIRPSHGILTHLGKKHLHTMGDFDTNISETMKLFRGLPAHSWLLVPKNSRLAHYAVKMLCNSIPWAAPYEKLPHVAANGPLCDPSASYAIHFPEGDSYQAKVPCEHHYFIDLLNMSIKAAWLLGARREHILDIIEHFVPEPSRTEVWQSSLGTTFINDSSCSDPFSLDNSLKSLQQAADKGRKIFVFSGLRSGTSDVTQDYRRTGQVLTRHSLDKLYLVGNYPYSPLIEEMQKSTGSLELVFCQDHEEAITRLRSDARHDDVILLKGSTKLPFNSLAGAFADASCSNLCIINLAAIEWNIKALRRHLPPSNRIMVMVKAQAYGSDSIRIARFLNSQGVNILGVSYADEAVVLRRAGINSALFVIDIPPYEAHKAVKWNLEAGVSSADSIASLGEESLRQGRKTKVHLHIDTGMSRFGCRPEDALFLGRQISQHPGLEFEGIMTHFACSEDPQQDAFTLRQASLFDSCIAALASEGINPPWKHAANSAAALRFSFSTYNMVRIGLAAWGLHASETAQKALELRLALALISHIEGINVCRKGDTISYGRSYTVQKNTQTFAVLPMGYFDGLHRNYSGKAHVMIRGCLAPMVGTICMDYMMVDVTEIPQARVGDPVLIFGMDRFGQFLSPEGLARSGNSIAHELITCLGPRIPRVFIYEDAL